MSAFSVIIPAHDEAAVIDRALAALTATPHPDPIEIVVVANGCTDDTAARARAYAGVTVVEIATPSKIAALNAGDDAATLFPRMYLDADAGVDLPTLAALADVLVSTPAEIASPRLVVDASHASWIVRQHYRIWELSGYRTAAHIGSGLLGMSHEGRARFGAWPDVIADDRFAQQLFAPDERATLADHAFTVQAPRTFRSYLHRSVRIARGNRELPGDLQNAPARTGGGRGGLVARALRSPSLWVPFAVYCVTWTLPNVLAEADIRRGAPRTWNRDETTRATA